MLPFAAFAASKSSKDLRHDLLDGYDPLVPPTAGADVLVNLRVFKVVGVSAASSHMLLKVWFRQSWTDPRLVWSPGDYDNVTSAYFRAASRYDGASNNRGVNEIWLPDIRPYNLGEGFEDTLQPSDVLVNHTGGAFWSRPGVMDVLCKFDGLARFPFDHKLTCPIDVGGWMLDGQRQRVGLLDGGYEGDFVEDDVDSSATLVEASAGSSFTEWDLLSLSAVVRNLTYVCCGDDPWPVVLYEVTIRRNASFFYFYVLIFPPTTLAILAISVFFVSPAVGERLSFGVTLVVASQFGACATRSSPFREPRIRRCGPRRAIGKLVVMQLMPICSELLWVRLLLNISELSGDTTRDMPRTCAVPTRPRPRLDLQCA